VGVVLFCVFDTMFVVASRKDIAFSFFVGLFVDVGHGRTEPRSFLIMDKYLHGQIDRMDGRHNSVLCGCFTL